MEMAALAFAYPGVWMAAAAVAAPVLIHLILRRRPRRVIFPAMRFVQASHQANRTRNRLRYWLLLAMRVVAVLAIVALLAGPRLAGSEPAPASTEPAAVVVAIDNSGSMGYRFGDRTHLAYGKAQAKRFIEALPAGSRVAVIAAHDPQARAAFHVDRRLVLHQLEQVPQTSAALPVAPLLRRAQGLLAEADLPRRLVLLVNDRTARSWEGMAPTALTDPALRVRLLDCWRGDNVNVALGAVRLRHESLPAGAEAPVEVAVSAVQPPGEVLVRLHAGQRLSGQTSVHLESPRATALAAFSLRPEGPGLLEGRLDLGLADPLALDNVRYFTLAVRPPRTLLVVRDAATVGRADPTSFLMGSAAAPGGLAGNGSAIRREVATSQDLARTGAPEAAIVLLANVAGLAEAQWRTLESYVRDGGRLWVVPGPLASVRDWNTPAAQALLPARVGSVETAAEPIRFAPGPYGQGLLEPFDDPLNAPLTDLAITRRLGVQALAQDAVVELRYADGLPALVRRPVGRGEVVWWNFSPEPDWSDLARREQLPILARRTALVLLGGQDQPMNYTLGQSVRLEVPPGQAGSVWVRPPGGEDFSVAVDGRDSTIQVTADRVGHWRVKVGEGGPALGFAVNAPAEEADLALLAPDVLAGRVGPGRLTVAGSADELHRADLTAQTQQDLRPLLGLALLGLLLAETALANRFYRRPAPVTTGG